MVSERLIEIGKILGEFSEEDQHDIISAILLYFKKDEYPHFTEKKQKTFHFIIELLLNLALNTDYTYFYKLIRVMTKNLGESCPNIPGKKTNNENIFEKLSENDRLISYFALALALTNILDQSDSEPQSKYTDWPEFVCSSCPFDRNTK